MKSIEALLDFLWQDYVTLNPATQQIHDALLAQGGRVVNDHIAFRTFDRSPVRMETLAWHFTRRGYVFGGEYDIKDKRVDAIHLDPPRAGLPKVFVSQLRTREFSVDLQLLVHSLVGSLPHELPLTEDFLWSGAPWGPISFRTYEKLRAESEYAAWLAAFGYRANHFTVAVHELAMTDDIRVLNACITSLGHPLNAAGGEVKGTPAQMLEQSSTLAAPVSVAFSDGVHAIPGCYYEFAKRYPAPDGKLFGGFIETSATKLFESTTAQKP